VCTSHLSSQTKTHSISLVPLSGLVTESGFIQEIPQCLSCLYFEDNSRTSFQNIIFAMLYLHKKHRKCVPQLKALKFSQLLVLSVQSYGVLSSVLWQMVMKSTLKMEALGFPKMVVCYTLHSVTFQRTMLFLQLCYGI
jgi:hypothetical protein